MTSTYPSIIATLTNPNATDRLNSPAHHTVESNQNNEISQIETFVGTIASVPGTIIYDVRSPASNGGGHVQTAVLGGTGQVTYNKGDILVASGASVLSKLTVGTNGQVLQAQSGQATGVQWTAVVANKVAITATSVILAGGAGSVATVMYAASITGSTLGINNGIEFNGLINSFTLPAGNQFTIIANYGNNSIASAIMTMPAGSVTALMGTIEGNIIGNLNTSSQIGYIKMLLHKPNLAGTGSEGTGGGLNYAYAFAKGTSSVQSDANQNLIITGQYVNSTGSITAGHFIVKKIV